MHGPAPKITSCFHMRTVKIPKFLTGLLIYAMNIIGTKLPVIQCLCFASLKFDEMSVTVHWTGFWSSTQASAGKSTCRHGLVRRFEDILFVLWLNISLQRRILRVEFRQHHMCSFMAWHLGLGEGPESSFALFSTLNNYIIQQSHSIRLKHSKENAHSRRTRS